MGYFLRQSPPMSAVVTRQEYLDAVDCALGSLSRESRGTAYHAALEDLAGGRSLRAACIFSSLLARRPHDPTLHRMVGISYLRAGRAQVAARHLETALMLLTRAATPGLSLLRSLRIEFEACVVRFALMAAYERLGHRAGMIRCLVAQSHPLAWDIRSRPRV